MLAGNVKLEKVLEGRPGRAGQDTSTGHPCAVKRKASETKCLQNTGRSKSNQAKPKQRPHLTGRLPVSQGWFRISLTVPLLRERWFQQERTVFGRVLAEECSLPAFQEGKLGDPGVSFPGWSVLPAPATATWGKLRELCDCTGALVCPEHCVLGSALGSTVTLQNDSGIGFLFTQGVSLRYY